VVVEIGIGTGNGWVVRGEVFSLQRFAIGGQDEACLALSRGGAGAQGGDGGRGLAGRAGGDVDVVGLKDAARSDLFDTPVRRRFSVVSLFPKASRN